MEYRDRVYEAYVSTHLSKFRDYSPASTGRMQRDFAARYSRFLPADKTAKVLDVGCGAGEFVMFLERAGYSNVEGIDAGAEQIELARKLGARAVKQADAFRHLEQSDSGYELICAHDVIEHFSPDEMFGFLAAVRRALKPGGRLLVSTVNCQTLVDAHRYSDITHQLGFTPNSLRQTLFVSGFADVMIYPKGPVPIDPSSVLRTVAWAVLSRMIGWYVDLAEGRGTGPSYHHIVTSVMIAVATRPRQGGAGE